MLGADQDFGLGNKRAGRRRSTFRINRQVGAVDFQGGFTAPEYDSPVIHAAVDGAGEGNHELPRIRVSRRKGVRRLPGHMVNLSRGGRRHGRGLAHIPLNNVNPVSKEVS